MELPASEIETMLMKLGREPGSRILYEFEKDILGSLTRFKYGWGFVNILL